MASFRGFPCCSCLAKWLPVYERMLLRHGVIKHNLDIYQLTGRAAASAGTHSQGGAFDIAQDQGLALWIARQMGADATWGRRIAQGFSVPHAHGVLRGCPHNAPARYQVAAVDAGYNGLGYNGRGGIDDGPRPLSGRTWKEGIKWAENQMRVRTFRVGTWNVDLKVPHSKKRLADKVRRIRNRVEEYRLDALLVQECPTSGQGIHLKGNLTGRDGRPMRMYGGHGRYVFLSQKCRDVRVKRWEVHGGKWATAVAFSWHGRRYGILNLHPVSGSSEAAKAARARYASKAFDAALPWFQKQGVRKEDVIVGGDHNGSATAVAGAGRGFVRARKHAKWRSKLTRTFQAYGAKPKKKRGGQFDYFVVHGSKRKNIAGYRNVQTPKASDHNLVVMRIKE